ncbi:uncharacterized protein [Chanodichthys erythropterus]|uniref:uncharacterized protein isoform X6 n=1 Tax=Chanodichthys erythropterus TaxID=933992 RepID=UPI00351EC651
MASKDAWTALKYLLGLHIAILLTHFSYKDGPLDHWIRQKSTGVNESIVLRSDYFYIYKGFDTEDGMPGNGQKCEEMDRPCEKYNEGRLSYQYRSGDWKPILDDCVLQVIKDLERRAKASVEQDIPVFVAQLSNATVQHNQEITQSPVTVRTIVGILVHITDISQNITINKPVMENFLKTVDILVSDKSRETWRKLNTGNTTSNTSTELLSAIEDISSRLTDDSFTINETSIELIRTVIENSYRANSKLPNSTTKILIPQVHKPTSLTIIVFTTLYNVLPTRDTRNNNSRKSDVQINGDVVVIKGFFILVMKLLTVPKVRETLSNVFRMLRKRENNIPEVIIPEDNKRAPEQISLPVIQVSNQNVHLNDNDEHADVNDSTGHHEAHSNTESHDLPESDCLLPPNTDSHKDDSKNVHLNDNDEHGDVNDSTGHHEVNSDSESRDLSESDCLLPPNTDSHKDVDSSGLQDEIEQNELVVPTAQNQQEVPLSDCSNMRSALMDPSSSQCMHSVPRALWDVKYVCCDGGKLLARVLNVEKRTTMSMKSLALLMHLLF